MKRALITAVGIATTLALPGCIFVDGSSTGHSSYRGYGSTTKTQLDAIVAANTQNRIGEPTEVVLGRFPAEHISLIHSSTIQGGTDLSVYRVYAREKGRGTLFKRFLAFEDNHLALLTDDEDNIEVRYGPGVEID